MQKNFVLLFFIFFLFFYSIYYFFCSIHFLKFSDIFSESFYNISLNLFWVKYFKSKSRCSHGTQNKKANFNFWKHCLLFSDLCCKWLCLFLSGRNFFCNNSFYLRNDVSYALLFRKMRKRSAAKTYHHSNFNHVVHSGY